ncbi:MAG: hypothetical protein IKA38_06955 [Alistipes sp.]|nr:hypothetical protein [Alistipes sp.]
MPNNPTSLEYKNSYNGGVLKMRLSEKRSILGVCEHFHDPADAKTTR